VGDFISDMSRTDFVKQFVRAFLEPGYFARFIRFLGNLVPNVGPLTFLQALTDNVKQIFFMHTETIQSVRKGNLHRSGQEDPAS
jgi:hypothetical protein